MGEQILLKAAQVEKNLEEIQKTREDEHRKRREARERRKSETDARRKREEEERERKAAEILLDEKRKEKIWQIKAELDEQKRIQAKLEKEKLEKEKLRRVEEWKIEDEERLKKEYEEREKH